MQFAGSADMPERLARLWLVSNSGFAIPQWGPAFRHNVGFVNKKSLKINAPADHTLGDLQSFMYEAFSVAVRTIICVTPKGPAT